MQRNSSFNKNSLLLTFNIILYFILACDWIQLPHLLRRYALEFSSQLDSSGCVELLERLQLEIQFKRQKKKLKMITPIWIRKAYFSIEMFFCSLPLTIKCNGVFLVWFVQKIQGRDWRLPKTIGYQFACRFELFQFPPAVNWNFSFTHMHMELRHAVTIHVHQWTRTPAYYYNISSLQLHM